MKIGALVQGDFNDKKLFIEINTKKAYEIVIEKLKRIDLLDEIIIIAPDSKGNDYFNRAFGRDKDVKVFLGDQENVCNRIIDCCDKYDIDIIVRLPAIKPLFDEQLLKSAVNEIIAGSYDYARHSYNIPDGLGIEVYTLEAIKRVQNEVDLNLDTNSIYRYKPHYYMEKKPNDFKIKLIHKDFDDNRLNELRRLNKIQEERADNSFTPALLKVTKRYEYAIENINKDDIVLDIACATGVGCLILAQKCKRVVGVGYNSTAIDKAREECNGYSNIKLMTGNALELSIENKFDVVISFETIEHLYEDYLFVSNLYRSLKNNGKLIISAPLKRNNHNPLNPYHIREYTPDQMEDMLCRSGFEILDKCGQEFSGDISRVNDTSVEGILYICTKRKRV